MALSGSFYTNVGNHWRLQLEWSAKQSISGNYSDVTARLYWIARDRYGAVYSSASKTASITIAGNSATKTASGLAKLSGNQKKLIYSRTVRVNHNSDGTGSFSISAYFDADVTLQGVYRNRISLSSRSFTLNRIPRASSITSSASWTAGNNRSVSISRASSKFTHTVRWQIQDAGGTWRTIKTATGVGTSVSSSFTTSQHKSIFTYLAQNSSRPSRIQIETFQGSTKIGSTVNKTGTITAPSSSTLTSGTNRSMYTDDSISVGISRNNSNFTHKVEFIVGGYTKTINGVGTSTSWNPSSTEENSIHAQMKTQNSRSGTLRLTTYYEDVQVRSSRSYTFTFRIRNANPTFSGDFTYLDTNSTTVGITGNNQYIIQGKSTLRVDIPVGARATANKGADMSHYLIKVNGQTYRRAWSSSGAVTYNVGALDVGSNISLTVEAVDSRGNSTSRTKTLNVLPYKEPSVNVNAQRLNSFEAQTTIKVTGGISLLKIGTSNKNSISTFRYRYKRRADSTYGSWANLTATMSGASFSSTVTRTFNNLQAWDIQVQVIDKLTTQTVNIVVPVGKPMFFLDAKKNSVGINRMPTLDFTFEVDGKVYFNNPNTTSSVLSYVGSTSSSGREWLAVRADRSGFSNGAGINLYNGSDTLYPNAMKFYAGGSGASKITLDNEGIKLRQTGNGNSNVLRLTYSDELNSLYGSGELIGTRNKSALAFIQHSNYARTLFFGTSAGGSLSLEATGSLFLPRTSGTTRRIEMSHQNMISTRSGRFTLYPNRSGYSGEGMFEIRSHNNKSDYRTDFYMDSDGNGRFNGDLTVDRQLMVDSSGASNGLALGTGSTQHVITRHNTSNAMYIYPQRYSGENVLTIRSHHQKGSYRDDFWIRNDGRFASAHLYNNTSSNSANARVSYTGSKTEGMIYRSTSAKKYKTDIRLSDINPYNILKLEPKSWYDKGDVMRNGGFTNGLTRNYGLIADELEEVGLHHFIDYINGEIEGLEYERLWTLLIPIVRDQQEEIERLSKTIEVMKKYLEGR